MVKLLITDNFIDNANVERYTYDSMEEIEQRFKNKNLRIGVLGDYTILGLEIHGEEYDTKEMNLFDWLYTRIGR
mgnify:CR=1 FL=1